MYLLTNSAVLILVVSLTSTYKQNFQYELSDAQRIIGGEEAVRHEFPWVVDIRKYDSHICTGSIVTEEWVATAAQCIGVEFQWYYYFTVVAGDHNIEYSEINEQRRKFVRVVVHPEFERTTNFTFKSDIALVQVSPPFVFNEFVQPAIFAARGWVPTRVEAAVTGWGSASQLGNYESRLQKVTVPLISDSTCRSVYGQEAISDSMICAGDEGKDFCRGDSGSPLLCKLDNGINVVCGISSWGEDCGMKNYPGVYSEVSFFSDWIYSIVVPQSEDNSTWVEQNEGCGGILVGSSGRITYKLNRTLEPNERCSWTIRANNKENIRIQVLETFLEEGDLLTVNVMSSERGNVNSSAASLLNGTTTYTFQGPVVFLSLYTGNSGTIRNGFSLQFQGIGHAFIPNFLYTHFHLTDRQGSISYPGNGSNYKNKEMATFVIHPPGSSSTQPTVRTNINIVDIEPNYVCWYDGLSLQIYSTTGNSWSYGYKLNPEPNRLCGNATTEFLSNGGMSLLIFKTDFSNTRSGFNFSWTIA